MTAPGDIAFSKRQRHPWQRVQGLEAVLATWASDAKIHTQLVFDIDDQSAAGQEEPLVSLEPGEAGWRMNVLNGMDVFNGTNVPHGMDVHATDAPSSMGSVLLHKQILEALKSRGINSLYSHQLEAFKLASVGKDIVVATPTASGKSLCYNLPVLNMLASHAEGRALYLFPTKALSRDQEESLRGLLKDANLSHGAVTFDGDTPQDARRAARQRSGILVTNPDMLHAGILPQHANWARFFANLKFVVIDELHMYRGVFGSHLANIIRRLLRIAAFHGASPQFLFSSATIRNPKEHASRLLGRDVLDVCQSGAPKTARKVLVYNPPLINAELGLRRSYLKCAVDRASELIEAGVSTIIFGQSRNQVEIMLKYLRDKHCTEDTEKYPSKLPLESIQAYRGGYLPQTRRRIEQGLRNGDVICVVGTNALELGIDIGSLEAVICAGYPGSLASLWQRFGRGGRRGRRSLALLIPSSNPLDQFIARNPRIIWDAPVESARIDPDNVEILIQHLKCAAYELPFEMQMSGDGGEPFGDLDPTSVVEALDFLAEHKVVKPIEGRNAKKVYHWAAEAYPASNVSLRSVTFDNFVVINVQTGKTIAEMDFRSTHTMLHEQAIYQHEGAQYQVERLDYDNHKAYVRWVEPDYYTTAKTNTRVSILEQDVVAKYISKVGDNYLDIGHGEVDVLEKIIGFKKIKYHTHENVGYGEINLPAIEKVTTGFWVTVPEQLISSILEPRAVVMDALRGWLSALHVVSAIGLMMDPRDLGYAFVDERGLEGQKFGHQEEGFQIFEPTLYLYDSVAGGIGLAPRLFEEYETLLKRSAQLVSQCTCSDGCPSCVGPVIGDAGEQAKRKVLMQVLTKLGLL